jgi:hypothetical protein
MIDLKEMYDKAIQEGRQFVLTEEMLNVGIKQIDKTIQSIDDLVMVHKTSYFPNKAIKTPFDTKKFAMKTINCKIDGEDREYKYPIRSYRNTVHFCLNGGVESHAYGRWDDIKYAILMPLSKNKDKIVGGTECDLFSLGSVPITDNAYILCPKEEIDKMKEANPTAHVIGYEGDSISQYVNIFLSNILGYKYKVPTLNSRRWDNGRGIDAENVWKLMNDNGWELTDHNGSKWDINDHIQQSIDLLDGWLKIVIHEKLLYSSSNIDEVKRMIIRRFANIDLITGYGFARSFEKDEEFEIICDRVMKETGIDLSIFKGTEIQKYFGFSINEEFAQSTMADYIVNELRIRALKEKSQTEELTEEDNFELRYYNEYGEFSNITKEEREMLRRLEELHSKSIDELSQEEQATLIDATNFKLKNLNKMFKENNFALKYSKGVTQEMSDMMRQVGEYHKPLEPGLYLTATVPNPTDTYSKISGVNIRELNDKINYAKTVAESYSALEQLTNIPNCHLLVFNDSYAIPDITDFDLKKCKTVADLESSVIKYAEYFSKMVSGQKVAFDTLGNELEYDRSKIIEPQSINEEEHMSL